MFLTKLMFYIISLVEEVNLSMANKAELIEKVASAKKDATAAVDAVFSTIQDKKKKKKKARDLTKKDATAAVDAVFSTIQDALANGEKVQLIGFGNFEVRERAARKGRNPQTGEEIEIPASKVPAFKPGKALKDAVK